MRNHDNHSTTQHTRRRLLGVSAAGALALTGVHLAPASADTDPADLVTRCVGTAGEVTVPGDLFVPAGESCLLQGTTVQGDVDVRAGAELVTEDGASLEGDVWVRSEGYLAVADGTVGGLLRLNGATGATVFESEVQEVDARNTGFYLSTFTEHQGYAATNTETILNSSWFYGAVDTQDGFLTDITDSVVTGDLSVRGAEWGSVVCGSEVDGDVEVLDSLGGVVAIGSQFECGGTVVGGDVNLHDNTTGETGTTISSSVIRGELACTGNDPAPTGQDNRVRGGATGQCEDLPPTDEDPADASALDVESRTADAQSQVDELTEAAREAALEVGPAGIGG